MSLLDHIVSEIRSRGPLTVAEFMERALYHPELGYYTRAQQRSGRDGDSSRASTSARCSARRLRRSWSRCGRC